MQIAQAAKRDIPITEYAQERGYTVKRVGANEYTLSEHDSIRINTEQNVFFRHSTGQCGSIIDFVMMIDNVSENKALSTLRDYLKGNKPTLLNDLYNTRESPPAAPPQKKELVLPEPAKGRFSRIYAYLSKSRGIDKEIITDMIHRSQLYEDVNHNCVFVGYDRDNKAAYANIRGTLTDKSYKGEASGSNKEVGLYIKNSSASLFITEAAIDAMSIATMLKLYDRDYKKYDYLSLGGTSCKALLSNLSPEIKRIYLALDNDPPGRKGRQGIVKALNSHGYAGKIIDKPPVNKDYNDDLKVLREHASQSYNIERG